MDELISKIIDIENKACAVVERAEKEQENINEIIKSEIEQNKSKIEKQAADKCDYIKNIEEGDAKKHLKETRERTDAAKGRLEEIFSQKHSEWVESITAEIINL